MSIIIAHDRQDLLPIRIAESGGAWLERQEMAGDPAAQLLARLISRYGEFANSQLDPRILANRHGMYLAVSRETIPRLGILSEADIRVDPHLMPERWENLLVDLHEIESRFPLSQVFVVVPAGGHCAMVGVFTAVVESWDRHESIYQRSGMIQTLDRALLEIAERYN